MKLSFHFLAVCSVAFAALPVAQNAAAAPPETVGRTTAKVDRAQTASQKIIRIDLSERDDAKLAEALAKVRQYSQPTIVDLTSSEVGGDLLKQLHGLPNLQELYLLGTDVSDRELRHLGDLPNLETIDLSYCKITAAGILQLRSSRKLKCLLLANTRPHTDDKTLKQIAAAWPDLESLSLADGGITDAGLTHVRNLRRLRYLNVSRTQITDNGLKSLAGLTHLTTLHAGYTKISDRGMAHLGKVTSLEKLDLNHTGITDRGLRQLQRLRNLKRIYFVGTKVTDTGLDYLKPLRTIEFVGPSENNSPEALEQLKESLPLFKSNKAG